MKKIGIGVIIGFLLALAVSVPAAPKTVTLTGPTDFTSGGYRIVLTGNAPVGGTSTRWSASTYACGFDVATQTEGGCAIVDESTTTPPAAIVTFINARLSNWRADQGY